MIRFGIDTLLTDRLAALRGRRVGLITNDAATTAAVPQPLTPVRLALQQAGVHLVALFAPEHGLAAAIADGAHIGNTVDPLTGLPVYSLYGKTYDPARAMLHDVDLLIFDIPDIGVRFYTYIWTLSHILEACGANGVPLWVLDRPNPLGGDLNRAEGPMLDESCLSTFVGRWSIPIRHSLTTGELATLWNAERKLGVELTVVPVQQWQRSQAWPASGLPFVPTSPAMPSYETALLYPGTCCFEATNLSDGRGTATPFRLVGAPWLEIQRVVDAFHGFELPAVRARGVEFIPAVGQYAGQLCQGVMLHVLDPAEFRPVSAGLHLLLAILRHHGEKFQWLDAAHFDRLVGDRCVRKLLADLGEEATAQIAAWTAAPGWAERVRPYLFYG